MSRKSQRGSLPRLRSASSSSSSSSLWSSSSTSSFATPASSRPSSAASSFEEPLELPSIVARGPGSFLVGRSRSPIQPPAKRSKASMGGRQGTRLLPAIVARRRLLFSSSDKTSSKFMKQPSPTPSPTPSPSPSPPSSPTPSSPPDPSSSGGDEHQILVQKEEQITKAQIAERKALMKKKRQLKKKGKNLEAKDVIRLEELEVLFKKMQKAKKRITDAKASATRIKAKQEWTLQRKALLEKQQSAEGLNQLEAARLAELNGLLASSDKSIAESNPGWLRFASFNIESSLLPSELESFPNSVLSSPESIEACRRVVNQVADFFGSNEYVVNSPNAEAGTHARATILFRMYRFRPENLYDRDDLSGVLHSDGIGTYLLRCLTTELPFAFPGNVWNSKSIAHEISKENQSKAEVLQFFIVLAAKKFAANSNCEDSTTDAFRGMCQAIKNQILRIKQLDLFSKGKLRYKPSWVRTMILQLEQRQRECHTAESLREMQQENPFVDLTIYDLGRVILEKRVRYKTIYETARDFFKAGTYENKRAHEILVTSGQKLIKKMLRGELDSLACKYLVVIRLVDSSKAKRPNRLVLARKRNMARVVAYYVASGHKGAPADFDLPYANHETPITLLQRSANHLNASSC